MRTPAQRIWHQPLRRTLLRRAATRYARHGWDVVPGACLAGDRFACAEAGCYAVACHPDRADWAGVAGHDVAAVRSWWRDRPRAVLLATGRAFDAVEVPAELGRFAAGQVQGPVAAAPSGQWLFLVRPGQPLRPELQGRVDVVLHGRGSWIAAPPTSFPDGRMRWEVSPEEYDWRLPDPYSVQAVLLTGLRTVVVSAMAPERRRSFAALRPAA
jgi:Bifunctional DNA primase/polymerase, N-terminal